MAAIFPPTEKGGVPPGASVVNGFSPTHAVVGDGPYYIAPTCSTVLTDAQMNAMVSEILAAVDELGFAFNTTRIDNLGQALGARFQQVESDIDGKVDRSGDLMSGPLLLAGNPTATNEAASKAYVDGEISNAATTTAQLIADVETLLAQAASDLDARKVDRSGDTMTGPLTMTGSNSRVTLAVDPIDPMEATTKAYVDLHVQQGGGFVEAPMDGLTYGRGGGTWRPTIGVNTADALTVPQQTQGRANLYAAPFDALAFNGLQVNGNMEASQLYGANPVTVQATALYVLDCWKVGSIGPQAITAQQWVEAPPGYTKCLSLFVAVPNATLGPNDHVYAYTPIEGLRCAKLAWGTPSASPIVVGFWIRANRIGPYSGSISSPDTNWSFPFLFTIDESTTWEFKTITVPGATSGTWPTTNTNGMWLNITMASGSTFLAPAGAWANGLYYGALGMVNGIATTSDFIQFTGVVVLPGLEPPSAEQAPLITRSADEEARLCYRYLHHNRERMPGIMMTIGGTPGIVVQHQAFVVMRSDPIVSLTTSTFGYESLPYQTLYTATNATVQNASHVHARGGDILLYGTFPGGTMPNPMTVVDFGILRFDSSL